MQQTLEIKLGEKAWEVSPFTVSQVQDIEELLLTQDKRGVALIVGTLAVALRKDYPDDVAKIPEMNGTASELQMIFTQILQHGGFKTMGDNAKPGEA